MLVLTRKVNQQIRLGEDITITVLRVQGNSIRIGVEAPRNVRVLRGELERRIEAAPEQSKAPEAIGHEAIGHEAIGHEATAPMAIDFELEDLLGSGSDEPAVGSPSETEPQVYPMRSGASKAPLSNFIRTSGSAAVASLSLQ